MVRRAVLALLVAAPLYAHTQIAEPIAADSAAQIAEAQRHAALVANERQSAAAVLQRINTESLCAQLGHALRTGRAFDELYNLREGVLPFARAELTRRRLTFSEAAAKAQRVRIGDGMCQLYASLGMPRSVNRTVTVRGERAQLVYDSGIYVYLQDGRVRAWQD